MKKLTIIGLCFIAAGLALADSFSGRLLVVPQWTHTKTLGASTVSETFDAFLSWPHTTGTSTNQMNAIIREVNTLTNGQARTVSLAGGVTDSFGDAITFTTVRFLCVTAPTSNSNTVSITPGLNGWDTWITATNTAVIIRPGGLFMVVAPDATGYAVTDANLTVTNDGTNTVQYSIYIGGAK